MGAEGGYLVVLKQPLDLRPQAPHYRGLDRVPPWDQKRFDAGWDDPLWTGEFVDEEHFSPTRAFADLVLANWAEVHEKGDLEVIYATSSEVAATPPEAAEGTFEELGFDVAGLAPFYSIVANVYPDLERFVALLNEDGLLPSREAALDYRSDFSRKRPQEAAVGYGIWRIFGEPRLVR